METLTILYVFTLGALPLLFSVFGAMFANAYAARRKATVPVASEARAKAHRAMEESELEYWAALGRLDRLTEAVAAGASVNARGPGGQTALHAAAANGHLEVIRFLASRRADLNAQAALGETPADLAEQAGQQAALELLRSLGGRTSIQEDNPGP
jgi:ankyrin repeat protein